MLHAAFRATLDERRGTRATGARCAQAREPQISDDGGVRASLIWMAASVVVVGCGSKKQSSGEEPPPASPAPGSGSASPAPTAPTAPAPVAVKVVPLVWNTPGRERLLALREDGGLEGPCGPVGTVAGGEVKIGGQTLQWTGVEQKGKTYKVSPLPWTITVGDGGAVTLVNPGHPEVALGTVTGTDSEDGVKLFSALVIAAPTIQIKLTFTPADGGAPYDLTGSADLDAWTIKQGAAVIATKKREDKAPAATHAFTEAPDGKVSAGGKVIGTLTGRQACTPHDKAVTALVETYLTRPR